MIPVKGGNGGKVNDFMPNIFGSQPLPLDWIFRLTTSFGVDLRIYQLREYSKYNISSSNYPHWLTVEMADDDLARQFKWETWWQLIENSMKTRLLLNQHERRAYDWFPFERRVRHFQESLHTFKKSGKSLAFWWSRSEDSDFIFVIHRNGSMRMWRWVLKCTNQCPLLMAFDVKTSRRQSLTISLVSIERQTNSECLSYSFHILVRRFVNQFHSIWTS
jgi:hypothetical protein